jgi:hypothetical protein
MAEESKREFIRVPNEFNVRLVRKDDDSGHGILEINTSKSINISGNGLLLNMNEKLEVGTILNITFIKPNTFEMFKGTGKIVRLEEDQDKSFKVAISFMDISDDDKKMLDYYVNLKK